MRFARAATSHDQADPAVDKLVDKAELDVLQLDYRFPQVYPADRDDGQGYAKGLIEQLKTLHKTLYLEPNFRLITNAGGNDTLRCVEAVAGFLCEHDSATLPLTAVRGDNVLAQLEEMTASGIELRDERMGKSLHELTQPIVAAQVELGAGPLKAALDEGSRLVITGCYDNASPLIAAATSITGLSWDRTDMLAQLAIASNCQYDVVDLDDEANLEMYLRPSRPWPSHELERQIRDSAAEDGTVIHADVRYQVPEYVFVSVAQAVEHPWRLDGESPTGNWRLRVTYIEEYSAEALWEVPSPSGRDRDPWRLMNVQLIRHLGYRSGDDTPRVYFMGPIEADGPLMVRAEFRNQDRRKCEDFVARVKNYVARTGRPNGAWIGVLPTVHCRLGEFCCEVPRDAIAVSVDTRPASEWR